ncbi:MAG: hypothetical protein ACI4PP_00605 [Clostridia bacterium]
MVKRTAADPLITMQAKDLQNAEEILYWNFLGQLEAFYDLGALTFYPGDKGFMIGYSTEKITGEKLLGSLQNAAKYLMEKVPREEIAKLCQYAAETAEVNDEGWYNRYCRGEVYNLQLIILDEELKGTGAFRRLITPVLESCEKEGIPVVLQTNNPDNVPLYEHFGFTLTETRTSDKIPLVCYCMARGLSE